MVSPTFLLMRSSSCSLAGRHNSSPRPVLAKWLLAGLCLFASGGCASVPPAPTLQLRAFLGAAEDGGFAYAEVAASPGAEPRAVVVEIGADGKERAGEPLAPPLAEAALSAAKLAAARPSRTADAALAGTGRPGFARERATRLQPAEGAPAHWRLEPVAGVPCELRQSAESGELRFALRLEGEQEELLLARLPAVGESWVESVLLLPAGRRALALTGSAWQRGGALYRLEGIAELEVGAALAVLLDARALANLRKGERERAREDLQRAIGANPADPVAHYNLACALALLGEEDAALLALGRAVKLEERLRDEALRDPDLDPLRTRVEFRLMIEPRSDDLLP